MYYKIKLIATVADKKVVKNSYNNTKISLRIISKKLTNGNEFIRRNRSFKKTNPIYFSKWNKTRLTTPTQWLPLLEAILKYT